MVTMSEDTPAAPGSSPALPVTPSLPSPSVTETTSFANGPPACTGCNQPIQDEFILRVQGHLWHAQCLQCAACKTTLTHTCYVRGSRVFCQMDFYRLFGASCAGCGDVIPPSDVVRRAHDNIYHNCCFCCVICGVALNTGDEFYLRDDLKLICKADFHNASLSDNSQDSPDQMGGDPCHRLALPSAPPGTLSASLAFTPQETEVLRELYSACANPSQDTLQRLSSQYGLDLNRVRLWFHLSRAEDGLQRCGGDAYGAASGYGNPAVTMETVVAPPGGYPLPIVNEVSSGRLPPPSRTEVMSGFPLPMSAHATKAGAPCVAQWPLSEDMWSSDFVPPNVDLDPDDIKDGEVCEGRRGFGVGSGSRSRSVMVGQVPGPGLGQYEDFGEGQYCGFSPPQLGGSSSGNDDVGGSNGCQASSPVSLPHSHLPPHHHHQQPPSHPHPPYQQQQQQHHQQLQPMSWMNC